MTIDQDRGEAGLRVDRDREDVLWLRHPKERENPPTRHAVLWPAIEYTATTVVIVLKVEHEAGERTIGFVVDAVSDVYNVTAEQFNPAPDFGEHAHTDFIRALATVDDKMVILLDIDQLVGRDAAMHAASQH